MLKKLRAKLEARARALGAVGVASLAIGSIASALNVNLAPSQVDALITAGAVLAYIWREFRATREK